MYKSSHTPARQALALLPLVLTACAAPAAPGGADPSSTPPGVTATVHEDYYDISGATAAELAQAMREQRPKSGSGWVVATTTWDARLDYRRRKEVYGCRANRVTLKLRFTIALPRWQPPAEASAELMIEWYAFLAAVRAHEERHKEITIAQARELIEALEKVRASSCDGLHSTVLLARQRFIDVAGELNAEYDLRTDHGGREGVEWPPDPS